MIIRFALVFPMLWLLAYAAAGGTTTATAAAPGCTDDVTAAAGAGVFTQVDSHACVASDHSPSSPSATTLIRWVDCGARGTGETTTAPGGPCVQVAAACAGRPPRNMSTQKTTMVAQVAQSADGSQRLMSIVCDAPVGNRPAVTAAAVRAEAQKLVPHPHIGVAPPGGVSLVNIQTLLWVDTAADRDLGTVTLLGQRVGLRVHVHGVAWNFGDGIRTTAATPGRRYDPKDPCRQALCSAYWGHVYRTTGSVKITAQVTWTGEFRVGAGAWQQISGMVTGPSQTATVTIRQARGVLVPNDTGR